MTEGTPAQPANKPHLSKTQIEMFFRCPVQYERRYIRKEKIPPGIAALNGRSVHTAAETNMKQKIESYVDMPVNQIVEVAVSNLAEAVKGGIMLSPEESSRGEKAVIGDAIDETRRLAEFHAKNQASDYQPILVEQSVRIALPMLSHDLVGVLDVVDNLDRVSDFKNKARRPSEQQVAADVQLSIYGAAFTGMFGKPPAELRLDCTVKNKRLVRHVAVTKRTPRDYNVLAERMKAMLRSIEAGIFMPAPADSWMCSLRYCGYSRTCPYFNSESDRREDKGAGDDD